MSRPTEERPLRLRCPVCDGRGCEACSAGILHVTDCPRQWSASAMNALRWADWAQRGSWWCEGGIRNQPAKYVQFVEVALAEIESAKFEAAART